MKIKYFSIDGTGLYPDMTELTVEQAVAAVGKLQPGDLCELYLDDERDEVPNIGLIFGSSGYQSYGLGGDDDLSVFVKEEIVPRLNPSVSPELLGLLLTKVVSRFREKEALKILKRSVTKVGENCYKEEIEGEGWKLVCDGRIGAGRSHHEYTIVTDKPDEDLYDLVIDEIVPNLTFGEGLE